LGGGLYTLLGPSRNGNAGKVEQTVSTSGFFFTWDRGFESPPSSGEASANGLLGDRWFSGAIARILGKSVAVGIR
jgi:hypothetical protein